MFVIFVCFAWACPLALRTAFVLALVFIYNKKLRFLG